MPGETPDMNTVLTCPHAAKVTHTPTQQRVKVLGAPMLVVADQATIAGCPFTVGNKPSPCIAIQWTAPAMRVKASGQPVLVRSSVGLCKSPEQAPQGPAIVSAVQPRVKAM